MRHFTLSLFVLVLTNSTLRSQVWTPHWQSADFQYSTNFFENESYGYAAFENFFFRLNDHGNSWETLYYEDLKKFVTLDFQDTQNGWAIMEDQQVWSVRETNDGGLSWTQHGNLPEGFGNYYLIKAYDDTNVLVATNSRVFRSTDSGETWSEVLLLSDPITGLYFQDATTAWVSGGNGKLYRSDNSGLNWTLINLNVTTYGVSDVQFTESGNIYALIGGGYGGIRKSENNGSSWSDISTGFLNQAMLVQDDNNIFVSSTNGIYRSTNGGGSWNNVHSWSLIRNTYRFYQTNASEIVLAGFGGQLYFTSNNGISWTEINSGYGYVTGMDVLNSSEVWAVGASGFSTGLMHSENGGENWHLEPAPTGVLTVDFVDPSTGYAIGTGGLSKTTDGGTTWIVKNASITSGKLVAIDAMNVHVLRNNNTVHNSFDGGETWGTGSFDVALPLVVFPLYDMEFTSTMNGRLSGDSGYIYYTSDGGVNWIKNNTLITSIDIPECFYITNAIGWHSTLDILYKTTNGGASWSTINIPSLIGYLSSLHFYDSNHGMGVDSFGGQFRLMETTNGGSTWTDVTPGYINTQSLGTIWRSNEDIGFIASPDLGILRKDNSLCPLPVFVATTEIDNPQACIGGTGFISYESSAVNLAVEWYRDGEFLSSLSTLIILNVEESDSGIYECHLTDSNECGSYEYILYVPFTAVEDAPPTLNITSTDYNLCEGGFFELSVESSHGFINSVMWYQNGSFIGSGNPFNVFDVDASQAGNYSCTCFISSVCGPFTVESDQIFIEILDNYELFSSAPAAFDILCESQPLEVSASGFGYPNIEYAWYSNGELISTEATLLLEYVSAEMNGLLELHISGLGGCENAEDQYQWNLEVIPLADVYPPSLPYQIIPVCFGDNVTLYYESEIMPDYLEWYHGEAMLGIFSELTVSLIDDFYYGDYYCIAYYANDCGYNSETFLVYTLVEGDNISVEPTAQGTMLTPCGEDLFLTFNSNNVIDSYEWVHNGETIGTSQTLVLTPGVYYYGDFYCTVSASNSCGSATESYLMYTVIESEPYPLTYSLISDYTACLGFPIEISVDASTTFPGVVEYSWMENGNELSTSPSMLYPALQLGSHEIELVLSVMWTCGITQAYEYITINVEDGEDLPSEVNLQTLTICEADNITLECDVVIPNAEMTYQWFLDGISVGMGQDIFFNVDESDEGLYSCLVTAEVSCGTLEQEYDLYDLNVTFNPVVDPFFSNMSLSGCVGDIFEMEFLSQDEPYLVEWILNNELVFTGTNYVFEATENSSGEYYVYAYASNDCGTDEAVNVLMYTLSVEANLELPEDPGPIALSICQGPLELTFSPEIDGATYDWYNDEGYIASGLSITVEDPMEGLYTCSVSISNSCSEVSLVYQYLNLDIPQIVTPSITIDDQISVEDIFSSYEWYFNGEIVGTENSIENLGPGEYELIVTNETGCINTQTFIINSTQEITDSELRMYPNPAIDQVFVAHSENIHRVELYNSMGALIYVNANIQSKNIQLDVSNYSGGVYHLVIFSENKTHCGRIEIVN
jgi:photosystem II stability/assembly factor-like uncharacterized protein